MADIFDSMAKEIKTRQMFLWEDLELRKAGDGDLKNSKWLGCHPMTMRTKCVPQLFMETRRVSFWPIFPRP